MRNDQVKLGMDSADPQIPLAALRDDVFFSQIVPIFDRKIQSGLYEINRVDADDDTSFRSRSDGFANLTNNVQFQKPASQMFRIQFCISFINLAIPIHVFLKPNWLKFQNMHEPT